MTTNQFWTAMNAVPQNQSQNNIDRPNMQGNLSLVAPTIQQLNAAICSGQQSERQAEISEPAFGQHAREAAEAVKRIFSR